MMAGKYSNCWYGLLTICMCLRRLRVAQRNAYFVHAALQPSSGEHRLPYPKKAQYIRRQTGKEVARVCIMEYASTQHVRSLQYIQYRIQGAAINTHESYCQWKFETLQICRYPCHGMIIKGMISYMAMIACGYIKEPGSKSGVKKNEIRSKDKIRWRGDRDNPQPVVVRH